ncbi:hypothetical protein GC194_06315 [bacterium]|nr:hypothetical protein [bacterium]
MNRYLKTLLGLCSVAACMQSCGESCTYTEMEMNFKVQGKGDFASIKGKLCPTQLESATAKPSFYVLPVIYESALNNGNDPYTCFERGQVQIANFTYTTKESPTIVEIRDVVTLQNNLNHPYISHITDNSENGLLSLDCELELSGHPLYLMLALQDVLDEGGGKVWRTTGAIWPDSSEITELDAWKCILDNSYTFLKGNRFAYDPNGDDNSGMICDKELDYFTDPASVTKVYGTYSVSVENDEVYLVLKIAKSPSETKEQKIKVLAYDWYKMSIEVQNDAGEVAIAQLAPVAFPATFE